MNRYTISEMTVMDARSGMAEYHPGRAAMRSPGLKKHPRIQLQSPQVDRKAAGLLGQDWRKIAHVRAGFEQ